MQLTETLNEGLKRAYEITLTADQLDAKVEEKLIEAQPDIEMKGFRKGKVPMAILRRQYGSRILGDAMQDAIDQTMKGHFDATGHRPAMQPKVEMRNGETWKQGDDVVVDFSYETLPEIPEADFSTLVIERLVVKADEAEVTEALENLAKSSQNFEERPRHLQRPRRQSCQQSRW